MWKPAVMIPAIIAVLACGPTYMAKAYTKDGCSEGDKVAVAKDGWVNWVGKADAKFKVINIPANHLVCVVPLTASQATAFAEESKLSWGDFNKWKSQHAS
jgi:hypothetical protein